MASHERIRRQQLLTQAEGYYELGMSRHALEVLARCGDPDALPVHALLMKGECLRSLGQFQEAITPLARASESAPDSIDVWLALGWCQKRCGRIDLAIESLEEALSVEPNHPLILYNLACYWSLAKNKRQALTYLAQAFHIEGEFRGLVADEPDFDPIRSDPAFQALLRVAV